MEGNANYCPLFICNHSLYTCSELHHIENIEVFFPGEYTPLRIDGFYPQNGWYKVQSPLKQHPIFNGAERKTTIPIDTVRHVTHYEQAGDIKPDESQTSYNFTPKPKYGKVYDNEEEGSYKKVSEDTFQKIKQEQKVLKGNFSWWEMDAFSWYESDDLRGRKFGSAAASLYSNRVFVSPFMSNPRESRYGLCGFAVGFKKLLQHYKQSRTDIMNIRDRALFLRIGGTLRYRFETCYVVIVCTKHDHELECYPSLYTQSDVFDHKRLLLPSGKIKREFFESQEAVNFKAKYVIKCVPQKQYSSYEAPAFAFYYPETSTTSSLKCPKEVVTEIQLDHRCNRICQKKRQVYILEMLDSLLDD